MLAALNIRRQLTLFLKEPWSTRLDALRLNLDPVQASLIAAHVTICREDEIAHVDYSCVFSRVKEWSRGPLFLSFGQPRYFSGHGVLLPCEEGLGEFHSLRQWLLQDPGAREHEAHITLAHPRNPRAVGNTEAALASCPQALKLQFASVVLIEQHGSAPWRVMHESTLGGHARVADKR